MPSKARLFAAPLRRRMTAEQVLDSLLAAAGKEVTREEMNVDVDGSRLETQSINLGLPTRAWQFTSMSNERDRPSLSLPAAQTAVTLLETFGWRASRQDPLTLPREGADRLAAGDSGQRHRRQAGRAAFRGQRLRRDWPWPPKRRPILSSRPFGRFCRASRRRPSATCSSRCLADDFSSRKTGAPPGPVPGWPARDGVSWSNHLSTEVERDSHRPAEGSRKRRPAHDAAHAPTGASGRKMWSGRW